MPPWRFAAPMFDCFLRIRMGGQKAAIVWSTFPINVTIATVSEWLRGGAGFV